MRTLPLAARVFVMTVIGLAVAVSEGVLRGIRLRLPAYFRVPYYLILALFFLYPLALSPLVHTPEREELLWGLAGFSTVAGLVFLTLLPAARQVLAHALDDRCRQQHSDDCKRPADRGAAIAHLKSLRPKIVADAVNRSEM